MYGIRQPIAVCRISCNPAVSIDAHALEAVCFLEKEENQK